MISPEIDHAFPQNLLLKTACHRCEEKTNSKKFYRKVCSEKFSKLRRKTIAMNYLASIVVRTCQKQIYCYLGKVILMT